MSRLLSQFKRLPAGVRLGCGYIVTAVPVLLCGVLLPPGLTAWLFSGITAIFGVLGVALLFIRTRSRGHGVRLDREISEQTSGPSRRELADKEREYRTKWLEGIEKLKKARVSLYDLPWYVVLGEPGGGKTMTLLNSGMDFPMGKDELPGFGGTRNYNWWFTNTAVFLDTAGRLVFEKEGTTDRAEWEAFLKMLKRRRRCPINGIVLTLPADKLMSDSAEERDRSASILRDRLRQIQNTLDVRFPVFLLITKADLVAGFTEFYNELDSLQRNQMFGWSCDGDFDKHYDSKQFREDFDALYSRLHALRLNFLGREASEMELGWIHTYPEAFKSLRDRIQDYIDVVFSKNIFAEPLFFRGFYFTSALQEGRPILQVLGEHLSGEELDNLEGIFPQSRAFFIHDFYTRKVSREQGMVFRSQKHINRMRILRKSSMFIGAPLFGALTLLAILGYRSYSSSVSEPLAAVSNAAALVAEKHREREETGSWAIESGADDSLHSRALEAYRALDRAADEVSRPTGLAGMMFSSVGPHATAHIRTIQRELVGYCILRPEVARIETALTQAEPLTAATLSDFTASLNSYMSLHFGTRQATLLELRSILRSSGDDREGDVDPLDAFATMDGNLSAALTEDMDRRRQVIDQALQRVHTYWMSSTDIASNPAFEWWIDLFDTCNEIRESYEAILASEREFLRARDRDAFMNARSTLLERFPSHDDTATARLLQPLRDHLRTPPRIGNGAPITQLSTLIDRMAADADHFWKTCLTYIPLPESGAAPTSFAVELRSRTLEYRREFENLLKERRSTYDGRVRDLSGIIVGTPQEEPTGYAVAPPARETEEILRTEIVARLGNLQTSLDPAIDGWTDHLKRLRTRTAPQTDFDLPASWSTTRLRNVINAVDAALTRYDGMLAIEGIVAILEGVDDEGLAQFMPRADATDRTTRLRFENLKNRHGAAFLIRTVQSKLAFEDALSEAASAGVVASGIEITPLLDGAMRQYVHHYLNAWSQSYDDHRLASIERFDFNKPTDWDEFRKWINETSRQLRRDYRDDLEALFTHVTGPFVDSEDVGPDARQELMRHLDSMDWPTRSTLGVLVEQVKAAGRRPEMQDVLTSWRDFEAQAVDFRPVKLEHLTREPLSFPELQLTANGPQEWLTRQLQFPIEYGRWLLWTELVSNLDRNHLQRFGTNRPFLFQDGTFENCEPIRITATLDAIGHLAKFHARQVSERPMPNAAELASWLSDAAQWGAVMKQERFDLEIGYAGGGEANPNPSELYERVALRLPGLTTGDGQEKPELSFDSSKPASPDRFRWRPQHGMAVVALTGPDQALRGAELEPHVVDTTRSDFALLELVLRHGTRTDNGWVIELTKNVRDIQGLQDNPTETIAVVFSLRFTDPSGGLPPVLSLPDRDAFLGPKPKAPWLKREETP
jgi:hypothetical protein